MISRWKVSGNLYLELSQCKQTCQAELWMLAIISYWSADKLSSIKYLSQGHQKWCFTNSAQKSCVLYLSCPRVPQSMSPSPCMSPSSYVLTFSLPTDPLISEFPHPHVHEFQVPCLSPSPQVSALLLVTAGRQLVSQAGKTFWTELHYMHMCMYMYIPKCTCEKTSF